MKGMIQLTTKNGKSFVRSSHIIAVSDNHPDYTPIPVTDDPFRTRTYVETGNLLTSLLVRETPDEIMAMAKEAEAPTVDEIAAQALGDAVGTFIVLSQVEGGEKNPPKELIVDSIYTLADALVAERRRRAREEAEQGRPTASKGHE